MIVIIGINHLFQHRGPGHQPKLADELESTVREVVREFDDPVVAEEYSEEACGADGVSDSICCRLARELRLKHVYCDPTSIERESIGIPSPATLREMVKAELGVSALIGAASLHYEKRSAEFHSQRELFWLARLETYAPKDIVFVCGSAHVDSFSALVAQRGWDVRVIQIP